MKVNVKDSKSRRLFKMNPVIIDTTVPKKRVYKKRTSKTNDGSPGSSSDPIESPPERQLFQHQLDSVALMERAESGQPLIDPTTGFEVWYSFGTLQNPVGSGKTSVVLQLIKNDKMTFQNIKSITFRPYAGATMITGDPKSLYCDPSTGRRLNKERTVVINPVNVNIVVCSKPLTTVWKKEADIMGVKSVVFDAPRFAASAGEFRRTLEPINGVENGLIIVSTQMYGSVLPYIEEEARVERWNENYSGMLSVKRLILDDTHSNTKWSIFHGTICPLFTWVVNSTPELVYWSRFERYLSRFFPVRPNDGHHISNPGHLVNVPVPTDVYALPPIVTRQHYFKSNDVNKVLQDYLPSNVREMLETGDFDGAYRVMLHRARGEEVDESHPVEVQQEVSDRKPLHELVMERYRRELRDLLNRKRLLIENGMNTTIIEETINIHENKMKALEERLRVAEQECVECPICYDEMERGQMAITKCCNNSFCKSCISDVFKNKSSCPLCRKKISPMDIYSMQGDGTVLDMDLNKLENQRVKLDTLPSSPMEALLQIIHSNPRGKYVVFAPYEGSSKAFKDYFKNTGFQFTDLGGSAASIRSRLESFENGSINILFLSSRTSNAGLNLQFATDVVIIDTFSGLDLENEGYRQAIGRVRRFPRTTEVPVHHISPRYQ